jgi:hypothetical protein
MFRISKSFLTTIWECGISKESLFDNLSNIACDALPVSVIVVSVPEDSTLYLTNPDIWD